MSLYCFASISPNIRQLIQKETCEQIVLDLMNRSTVVFPGNYRRIDEQSHGESDFVSIDDERYFDMKILFSNEQCQYVSKGLESAKEWIESLLSEIDNSSEQLLRCNRSIERTRLFIEMDARLQSIKENENCILFLPFPIRYAYYDEPYLHDLCDILDITYKLIEYRNHEKMQSVDMYIIHLTGLINQVALRNLKTRETECVQCNELSEYITYTLEERPD